MRLGSGAWQCISHMSRSPVKCGAGMRIAFGIRCMAVHDPKQLLRFCGAAGRWSWLGLAPFRDRVLGANKSRKERGPARGGYIMDTPNHS